MLSQSRWAQQVVCALLIFMTPPCFALGLGRITLYSYLNEPLSAEIELSGNDQTDPNLLTAELAMPKDFVRAGVVRPFFLTKLKFDVTHYQGRSFIYISSSRPVKNPYLEFLVQLSWPEGRLVKGYTILIDPPPNNLAELKRPVAYSVQAFEEAALKRFGGTAEAEAQAEAELVAEKQQMEIVNEALEYNIEPEIKKNPNPPNPNYFEKGINFTDEVTYFTEQEGHRILRAPKVAAEVGATPEPEPESGSKPGNRVESTAPAQTQIAELPVAPPMSTAPPEANTTPEGTAQSQAVPPQFQQELAELNLRQQVSKQMEQAPVPSVPPASKRSSPMQSQMAPSSAASATEVESLPQQRLPKSDDITFEEFAQPAAPQSQSAASAPPVAPPPPSPIAPEPSLLQKYGGQFAISVVLGLIAIGMIVIIVRRSRKKQDEELAQFNAAEEAAEAAAAMSTEEFDELEDSLDDALEELDNPSLLEGLDELDKLEKGQVDPGPRSGAISSTTAAASAKPSTAATRAASTVHSELDSALDVLSELETGSTAATGSASPAEPVPAMETDLEISLPEMDSIPESGSASADLVATDFITELPQASDPDEDALSLDSDSLDLEELALDVNLPPSPQSEDKATPEYDLGDLETNIDLDSSLELNLGELDSDENTKGSSAAGSTDASDMSDGLSLAAGDADEEALAIKLGLAKQYLDTGDTANAREALEEVLEQATGDLRKRAEALLSRLQDSTS